VRSGSVFTGPRARPLESPARQDAEHAGLIRLIVPAQRLQSPVLDIGHRTTPGQGLMPCSVFHPAKTFLLPPGLRSALEQSASRIGSHLSNSVLMLSHRIKDSKFFDSRQTFVMCS
jgi:hypothetical protein